MKKLNSYQKETLQDFNYLMCNFKLDLENAQNKIINTLKENKDNIEKYIQNNKIKEYKNIDDFDNAHKKKYINNYLA